MLAALFKLALNVALKGSIPVFDYFDDGDFAALWAVAGDGLPAVAAKLQGKPAVIIVWETTAPGGSSRAEKLLESHLTPLDWALAFSNVMIHKSETLPDLHIIDLTSDRIEEVWAVRMRHQLLAAMPWLTLHAPLIPMGEIPDYREGYRPILSSVESAGLIDRGPSGWSLVREKKGISADARRRRAKGLEALGLQWMAALSQNDAYHDINNIIGPDLLATPDRRRAGLFGAILTRLEWSDYDLDAASDWDGWKARNHLTNQLFARPLSVYLIDDQLEQGWGRFLCRLIDGEAYDGTVVPDDRAFTKLNSDGPAKPQIDLFGCLGSRPLIDFLRQEAIFDRRSYRSQIDLREQRPEVVFVDLRLYSDVSQARAHTRELLDIARNRLRAGLAWEGIEPDEIKRIADWSEGRTDDAKDDAKVVDEALLLLPRLLALALPLTPIILFSSTGQAWLREQLKPYGNIFTGFEKPRVLSEPSSIEASLASLRQGLDSAVPMMRLRLQLAHAQAAVKVAERRRPPDGERMRNHHVEIYADETRSLEQGISSGIAVCMFPDQTAAENLQNQLLIEHRNAGTVWAGAPCKPAPELSKGKDLAKDNAGSERETNRLVALLDGPRCNLPARKRSLWSCVVTRVAPSVPASSGAISIGAFPDSPLDVALRFNLEFALLGLIPYYSSEAGFAGTIQIHLATRRVPYVNSTFAQLLCEAFDLGTPHKIHDSREGRDKWLVATAPKGSAFPLVRGWLHGSQKGQAAEINRITRIKSAKLGTDVIPQRDAARRRLFHDIADWVCTASGKERDLSGVWVWRQLKIKLTEKEIFPNWFVSTDGEIKDTSPAVLRWSEVDTQNSLTLMQALKAARRHVVGGDETDALRLMLRNTYVQNCMSRLLESEYCAQQQILLWMLRDEIARAGGRKLCTLLPR